MKYYKEKNEFLQKQLDSLYKDGQVRQKENELKALQMEAEALQREIEDKKQLSSNHNKGHENFQEEMQRDWQRKLKEVQNDIKNAKERNRELLEKVQKTEKSVNKNHEFIVTTKEKITVLANKIKEKKSKKDDNDENPSATEITVQDLEKEIQALTKQKRDMERRHYDNMRKLKEEYAEHEAKYSKLSLLVKQKEKEYRINLLKMKELKLIAEGTNDDLSFLSLPQDKNNLPVGNGNEKKDYVQSKEANGDVKSGWEKERVTTKVENPVQPVARKPIEVYEKPKEEPSVYREERRRIEDPPMVYKPSPAKEEVAEKQAEQDPEK